MSNIYSVSGKETSCPICGGRLTNLIYYTARPINSTVDKTVSRESLKTTTTTTTTTTYTDITQHTGGLCIGCGLKKGTHQLIVGALCVIAAIVLFALAIWASYTFASILGLLILGVPGLILILWGYSTSKKGDIIRTLLKNPDPDGLSAVFIKLLNPSDVPAGRRALSTMGYKSLH